MPSPFPGLDPWLEDAALWPGFQHQLVLALYQVLVPVLAERYRPQIGTRRYVIEQPLFTSILRDEHQEEYLELRLRSDGRLVTLVDVVSPTNRTTERGRLEYLHHHQMARNAGAHLVEIDLIRQGTPPLESPDSGRDCRDPLVTVVRTGPSGKREFFATTFQKPLPRFKLPLGTNDRDLIVDLGSMVARAYEQGGFASRIDYLREPTTPLLDAERTWVDQLLKAVRLRPA